MFLKPDEAVKWLPCTPGMRVADFGAGSGVYAPHLARLVGNIGSVYAFDVEPVNLECLGRACLRDRLDNVFPLYSDLNKSIPLRDELIQAGLAVNVLHALEDRSQFLSEAHRILKKNAPLLIIDWIASFKNAGPAEDRVVSPGELERLLKAHGFVHEKTIPAGSHHFAFLARRV